jgi:hypothetical protein
MWARLPFLVCIQLSISLSLDRCCFVVMPTPNCPVLFMMNLRLLLFPAPLSVSHTFQTPFYDRFDGWKIIVGPLSPAALVS